MLTTGVRQADNSPWWQDRHQGLETLLRILTMIFHQAVSPVIRAPSQAVIRTGGEQGRAAVRSCFLAGSRAYGLSWECCP